ncbi:MAG: thiamine diphosphokinase [Clostridia bacterium]|nr:thiamine diphosphokinase [Clostridia bacterium]
MKTCYIVGAGDFTLPFTPSEDDLVIAADGGYAALSSHGIRCDLLIGDFDSLSSIPSGIELLRFPVEKDDTDTALAYREGVRRGYTDFTVLGGVGGRDDHTFANLSLLLAARTAGHRMTLIGERMRAFVIKDESISISGRDGQTVSVFALGGDAVGVTLRGLYYPAENITLTSATALGVSNHLVGECAEVSVESGAVLVMVEI